jgi:hypothetical protein
MVGGGTLVGRRVDNNGMISSCLCGCEISVLSADITYQ